MFSVRALETDSFVAILVKILSVSPRVACSAGTKLSVISECWRSKTMSMAPSNMSHIDYECHLFKIDAFSRIIRPSHNQH